MIKDTGLKYDDLVVLEKQNVPQPLPAIINLNVNANVNINVNFNANVYRNQDDQY